MDWGHEGENGRVKVKGLVKEVEISPFLKVTPPKFNSSPLKNGGWKTTLLLGR